MAKVKQLPTRQRIRKGLLFVSFLLFPVTLYYFSPALILNGAAEGIVNASFITFGLMFVAALFVGRLWCGWVCPAGALQEFAQPINNKPTSAKLDWIKWFIWIPWIGLIAVLAIRAGGYRAVDPFYNFEGGVTMALPVDGQGPPWYMIYYIVVALVALLAVLVGRRAGCHTICWMAPFMILGRKLRNLGKWPALRLRAEPDKCTDCQTCTRNCPMSLDVNHLVRSGDMEDGECILCGSCVDNCPQDVLCFSFSTPERS
ncbi:MAG: 4Fe-4S binding protein [Anaerolineae bacterium]|nr:4Fe-4S binding protein [Anaerolineae bacterium]